MALGALKLLPKKLLPMPSQVLDGMVQLEQARTRAKAANKLALDAKKEKDAAEQEVQRLQQLLQAKRKMVCRGQTRKVLGVAGGDRQ
jgi:hypothetical protein